MKLGVLFSGGKDSTFAAWLALKKEEVACLISVVSENEESYMFHTPNIGLAELQAKAMGLPIIIQKTKGEKEEELKDLRKAIKQAKEKYKIRGVVTGAIASVYQATRIQKICAELDLFCFNPLWQKDQVDHLNDLLERNFEIIVTATMASQLNEKWLGRKIDRKAVNELSELSKKHGLNPAGEGGEIETFVLDAPFFKQKVLIKEAENKENFHVIKKAELVKK